MRIHPIAGLMVVVLCGYAMAADAAIIDQKNSLFDTPSAPRRLSESADQIKKSHAQDKKSFVPNEKIPKDALKAQKLNAKIIFIGKYTGEKYEPPHGLPIGVSSSSPRPVEQPAQTIVFQITRLIASPLPLNKGVVVALPPSEKSYAASEGEYLIFANPITNDPEAYAIFLKVDNPEQQIISLKP